MLTIRRAEEGDLAAVQALLAETWHATYDPIYGADKVAEITGAWHAPETLARSLSDEGAEFLIAERDGHVLATSLAVRDGDGTVCLRRLYVHPDGQGSGIGRKLLATTLAPFGEAEVWLEVEPRNSRAIAFYERCGFVAECAQASCGGRPDLAALRMRRRSTSILSIRPVRDDDSQDLFGLIALCFAEYPGCYVDPHDDMPDLRAPASRLSTDRRAAFWVVEDGRGRIGACVSVDFPEPGTAELHRLYVRPDLRRQGLARRLTDLVEEHARECGAKRLVLWSDNRFTNAHTLYERLGYERAAETRQLGDISRSVEFFFMRFL